MIVCDSLLHWHVGEYDPIADFTDSIADGGQYYVSNSSSYTTDYVWGFGDGTTTTDTNPTHTYTGNGTYHVTLIASHCGLTDTVSKTVTISVSGIQQEEFIDADFTGYPNPVTNELYLTVNPEFSGSQYVVYDKLGNAVMTGKIDSEKTVISLQGLENGFYFVCLRGQMTHTLKVIKY